MHEHEVDVGRQGGERQGDGVLPLGAPRDDDDVERDQQGGDRRDLRRRGGDDDGPDRRAGPQAADGVDEQRLPGEPAQRLGRARSEPLPAPGGRQQDADGHGRRGGTDAGVGRGAGASSGLPKTRRPFAVVSTLVTLTGTSLPSRSRPRSTTTIEPSSR